MPNLRSDDRTGRGRGAGSAKWANDVPGGQHLEGDAWCTYCPAHAAAAPEPKPDPSPARPNDTPDVITWPTSTFELDLTRHHIDLEAAGAGSLPLDPRLTYSFSLNKGPTLGWGFYVLNTAGSQPGALGVMPVVIKGGTRLFAYRIASVLLGATTPEETKSRTLLLQAGRGRPKGYAVPPSLKLKDPAGLVLQGLDPQRTYDVVVHQRVSPGSPAGPGAVSHVIVGHPTLGLLNTQFEVPMRVTAANRLWFTVIDNPSSPHTERPLVEVTDVTAQTARRPKR